MFTQPLRSAFSSSIRAHSFQPRPQQLSVLRQTLRFGAQRSLSNEARSKIQGAVTEHPLVLFMKGTPEMPQCGFSRAMVQILGLHGVPAEKMKTYNVLEDAELREGIKEFSEWPTIPQVYVKGDFVGGCDIVLNMHQSGELEKLLQQSEIIPKTEGEQSSEPAS